MFTDSLVDRHGQNIPISDLCRLLNTVCLPMAGNRISELIQKQAELNFGHEEVMIEFELCISAIFKPFLHYLKRLATSPKDLITVWMTMLSLMTQLLSAEVDRGGMIPTNLLTASKQLATEHLRNAVMILMSKGILLPEAKNGDDVSSLTWSAIEKISYVKPFITEWKESGTVNAEAATA